MNLQTAIQSGKTFNRQNNILDEGFITAEDFLTNVTTEDILAEDYVVRPDKLTLSMFKGLWNTSTEGKMPNADTSKVFLGLATALQIRGFIETETVNEVEDYETEVG
jgi:hypothetical protein